MRASAHTSDEDTETEHAIMVPSPSLRRIPYVNNDEVADAGQGWGHVLNGGDRVCVRSPTTRRDMVSSEPSLGIQSPTRGGHTFTQLHVRSPTYRGAPFMQDHWRT
jgi:hypothetical protein